MGIGRGNGKLILFGEHAAVYGHPAVGLQMPHYLEIEITDADDWRLPNLHETTAGLIEEALDRLPTVLRNHGVNHVPRGVLTLNGTLPMSVGLGSSAAFCSALLKAVAPGLTGTALWAAAHELESVFHGTPSGIDTGLSLYPGCSVIQPRPPGLPDRQSVTLPSGWIVAGAVPRVKSTMDLVAAIRKQRAASASVDKRIETLGALARRVAEIGRDGEADELGVRASEAHSVLESLGLSTEPVSSALGILADHGSCGGKISGGGGGGLFFGVFRDKIAATTARQALEEWLESTHPLPTGPFAAMVTLS